MLVLGPPSEILRGERIALNLMARLSAIATTTRRVRRRLVETSDSWCGRVAGTRKTTPGFRLFEKYALLVGGADAHRHDLSASIMLKDNHIVAFGSIRGAVQAVKTLASFTQSLEVECRNQEEALEAAEAGADIVMLDNFSARTARETARLLKDRLPHIKIEVSGGIGEENVASYSDPAIDVISMGCLTLGPHQVIDLSLNLQPSECHLKASE